MVLAEDSGSKAFEDAGRLFQAGEEHCLQGKEGGADVIQDVCQHTASQRHLG